MPSATPSSGWRSPPSPRLLAPHEAQPGPGSTRRVSTAGNLGHDLAERVDHVGGQVRAGGVPAGPARATFMLSQAAVIAPGPHAQPADVQPRVAVHREDPADDVERAGGDDVLGPGRGLLGGLEDQPDAAGEPPGRRPARPGTGRPRGPRWCGRRGRRRGRRRRPWTGTGRRSRPASAARRGRRAGRRRSPGEDGFSARRYRGQPGCPRAAHRASRPGRGQPLGD